MSHHSHHSGVKLRCGDKDQLISELRQQLYDLRNQKRDYCGINNEIYSLENRYRLLSDDKGRSEHDSRLNIDRQCGDVCDQRRQLEELKFLVAEKSKLGYGIADELNRSKQLLGEKTLDAQRLRDEGAARGVDVNT
jgi:chromosome segregation ATPase